MRLADQNYYLDATKTKVVTEESPEQAFLLVGKGCEITDKMLEHFPQLGKKKSESAEKAKAPAENKAAAPKANK
jgi:hypothetical protein